MQPRIMFASNDCPETDKYNYQRKKASVDRMARRLRQGMTEVVNFAGRNRHKQINNLRIKLADRGVLITVKTLEDCRSSIRSRSQKVISG